jgi:hypothetical protein
VPAGEPASGPRPTGEPAGAWWSRGAPLLLVGPALLTVYAPLLDYPFIQDDWETLADLHFEAGLVDALVDSVWWDRPLAGLYLFASHLLFGLDPRPVHVLGFLLHLVNCALLVHVLIRLTGDRWTSWCASVVYGAAAVVHLEPLAWMAGIEPLGAAAATWAAVILMLDGRCRWSAVAVLASLLFWPAPVLVPLGALIVARARSQVHRCWLPLAVAATYAIVRSVVAFPLHQPPSSPYAMALLGPHVTQNLAQYLTWTMRATCPVPLAWPWAPPLLAALVLAGCLAADRAERRAESLAWTAWWLLGLIPAIFMPNHTYRYYLTFSLVAGAVLATRALRGLAGRLSQRAATVAVVSLAVANVVASSVYVQRRHREGLAQQDLSGTNHLVARAHTVRVVEAGLRRLRPTVPQGATLVFVGIDVWSFGKAAGPAIWYDDPTLRVYSARHLVRRGDLLAVEGSPETQLEWFVGAAPRPVILLPRDRTLAFGFDHGQLVELAYERLLSEVAEGLER